METRAPYVLVGAFVVVLIAGLAAAMLWFAQVQFGEQLSYYDIYFTGSVTGLTPGSTVRYNGIPVGRVAEIKLDPVDPNRVRATVELQGGTAVKSDTVASLELQGLAGGTFVNLTGGTREASTLTRQAGERYPVIASRQSGLQRVVTSAPEVLARVIALSDQLGEMLNENNREAFGATLDNLRRITAAAANHSDEIDSAIADGAQTLHGLRATLDSATAILTALKGLVAPQGGMDETLRSVNETARRFADLAQRLDKLVADNEPQLHDFTRGGFSELQQLVQQSQQLVAQLGRIADSIERDPARFLYGDRRQGYQPK
jgi:phospholipid/cholesterol/gamma-HCH transport system substrate-binding protein